MRQKKQNSVQTADKSPLHKKQEKPQFKKNKKENKNLPKNQQKNGIQKLASQNKGKKRTNDEIAQTQKKQKLNSKEAKKIVAAPAIAPLAKFSSKQITIQFPSVQRDVKENLVHIVKQAKAIYNPRVLRIQVPASKAQKIITELESIKVDGRNIRAAGKRTKVRDPLRRAAYLGTRDIDPETLRKHFGAVSIENLGTENRLHLLTFGSEAAANKANENKFTYDGEHKFSLRPYFLNDNGVTQGSTKPKQVQTPQGKKQASKEIGSANKRKAKEILGMEDEDDDEDEDEDEEDDDDEEDEEDDDEEEDDEEDE